jgi:hypothetical protein
LSARNKRIELAALANLSCANNIAFESILRQNNVQNRFHTASVISDRAIQCPLSPLLLQQRTNAGAVGMFVLCQDITAEVA